MVPDIVTVGFVVAYALLLGLIAVRYRRGGLDRERLPLLAGTCLTWLSYGLLQLSQIDQVPTNATLNYVLDGIAIVCLVAGLALMYRWWRGRDSAESTATGQ